MSKLKSLSESNAEVSQIRSTLNSNEPRLNGIECPKCGKELLDSEPMCILTSNPPQKRTHCSNCLYTGYRFC